MTSFVLVATRKGTAYVRPDQALAVSSTEPGECMVLLTHGVTIAASEPAEVVVQRLEAAGAGAAGAQSNRETH